MQDQESSIEVVLSYLRALQEGEAGDALARFFTPDATQTEFPNLLNAKGQTSTWQRSWRAPLPGSAS